MLGERTLFRKWWDNMYYVYSAVDSSQNYRPPKLLIVLGAFGDIAGLLHPKLCIYKEFQTEILKDVRISRGTPLFGINQNT